MIPLVRGPLGALPPNPRDLSLQAEFEDAGYEDVFKSRERSDGRPWPSALRTQPRSGAPVASPQSRILPPGCLYYPRNYSRTPIPGGTIHCVTRCGNGSSDSALRNPRSEGQLEVAVRVAQARENMIGATFTTGTIEQNLPCRPLAWRRCIAAMNSRRDESRSRRSSRFWKKERRQTNP